MIPISAFGLSLITVSFPKLSSMHEAGRDEEYINKIKKDVIILMLISIPACIIFYFFAYNIINIVYPHLNDKSSVSTMLSTLSCTMPLYILSIYYARACFARRDPISPLISQSFSVVAIIISVYLLYTHGYGNLSIVYGFNISLIIEFITILFLFHYKGKKEI